MKSSADSHDIYNEFLAQDTSLSLRGQVIEYQRSSRRGTTSGSKRTALGLTSRQSAASCPGAGTPSE
jgi:hypothetical protein